VAACNESAPDPAGRPFWLRCDVIGPDCTARGGPGPCPAARAGIRSRGGQCNESLRVSTPRPRRLSPPTTPPASTPHPLPPPPPPPPPPPAPCSPLPPPPAILPTLENIRGTNGPRSLRVRVTHRLVALPPRRQHLPRGRVARGDAVLRQQPAQQQQQR